MNDYGIGDFFKKSFEMQQNMVKTWMDTVTPSSDNQAGDQAAENPVAAVSKMYQNLYDAWQKQFIDNPWMKATPWSYNMFNTENPMFDLYNKMMNSGKSLSDLSGLWQQLIGKDPFDTRDEILKFLEENKASYERLAGDFIKPFVPETMRPLIDNAMRLVKEYEAIGKDVVKPWLELGPQTSEDFKKIMNGDTTAYTNFYKAVNQAYEESYGKLFNVSGLGLTREQNEEIMSQLDFFFKTIISLAELMSLISDVFKENMVTVIQTYQNMVKEGKQPQSLKEFYDLWVKINEESFVKVFGTPQFSQTFCNFAKKSCEFKIHFDKVLEQMLNWAPFPKNSDMASLYKTVYELRKSDYKNTQQIAAMRDDLAAIKTALEQLNAKKGDK